MSDAIRFSNPSPLSLENGRLFGIRADAERGHSVRAACGLAAVRGFATL
jgi:hypothetical protein